MTVGPPFGPIEVIEMIAAMEAHGIPSQDLCILVHRRFLINALGYWDDYRPAGTGQRINGKWLDGYFQGVPVWVDMQCPPDYVLVGDRKDLLESMEVKDGNDED